MGRLLSAGLAATIAAAITIALVSTAQAVVISAGDGQGNTTAPGGNPGWNDMARLSGASAVYLGNGWMITANHVADTGSVQFVDGRTFSITPGSDVTLSNPAFLQLTTSPDLRMFRLATDPGLPSLDIVNQSPTGTTPVMMIGAGFDRSPSIVGWSVSSSDVWTPISLPLASATGFNLLSSSHMRWGMNNVSSATGLSVLNGTTIAFTTSFDRTSPPLEAQAVVGDSGGGVFESVGGTYKLAGIMDAINSPVPNQPGNSVAFGDQTYSVDLSTYRDQILALRDRTNPAWQNQTNFFDVNHSGGITPIDALLIITALEKSGGHSLSGTPGSGDPLIDVNGDGIISAADAIDVINELITGNGHVSVMAQGSAVPEPNTAVLTAVGAACAAFGCWVIRRRARTRRARAA